MASKNETKENLGRLDDNEFMRHLAQWLIDHQEEFLEYSPSKDADFINYEGVYKSLVQFNTELSKF